MGTVTGLANCIIPHTLVMCEEWTINDLMRIKKHFRDISLSVAMSAGWTCGHFRDKKSTLK